MATKKPDFVTEILNDFNALEKLFQVNQLCQQTERDLDEAKMAHKSAIDYRERLMAHIDDYTQYRQVKRAEQMALGKMFNEEPLPPWMSSKDPDGRGETDAE
jgi:hypothetical protein